MVRAKDRRKVGDRRYRSAAGRGDKKVGDDGGAAQSRLHIGLIGMVHPDQCCLGGDGDAPGGIDQPRTTDAGVTCGVGCEDAEHRRLQRRPALLSGSAIGGGLGESRHPVNRALIAAMEAVEFVHDLVASRFEEIFHAVQQPRLGLTQVDIGQDGQWQQRRRHQQRCHLRAQRPVRESERDCQLFSVTGKRHAHASGSTSIWWDVRMRCRSARQNTPLPAKPNCKRRWRINAMRRIARYLAYLSRSQRDS